MTVKKLKVPNPDVVFTIELSFLLFSLSLVAGVPLVGAVRLTLIFLVLGLSGYSLIHLFLSRLNRVLLVAVGLIMIIPIWTTIDQALRVSSLRGASLPVVGCLGLAAHLLRKRNSLSETPKDHQPIRIAARHSLIIGLLALLLLAQVWPWVLPLSLAGLFYLLTVVVRNPTGNAPTASIRNLSIPLMLVFLAGLLAISRRPDDWWLPGYGLDELEYLSHAAYTWGPSMDVLAAGIPLSYQWFHFSTLGLLENASGVDDFVVGTRFDFVSSTILVALLIWGFATERFGVNRKALAAASVACLVSTTMVFPNAYSLFSVNNRGYGSAYLAALPILAFAWQRSYFNWSALVPLIVVSNAMISTKTAVAIPLATALLAVGLTMTLRRQWRSLIQLIVLGSTLAANLLFSIDSTSGVTLDFRRPWTFSKGFIGAERWIQGTSQWGSDSFLVLVVSVSLLLAMTVLTLTAALRWIQEPATRLLGVVTASMLLVGYFFVTFADRVALTHLHFLQTSVVALIPIVTVDFFRRSTNIVRNLGRVNIAALIITGVVASLAIPVFVNLKILPQAWNNPPLVGAGVSTLVLISAFVISNNCLRFRGEFRRLDLVLLVLISFSATNGVTNAAGLESQGHMDSGVEEGQLGSENLRAATSWIAENTAINDIVATNAGLNEFQLDDSCVVPPDGIGIQFPEDAVMQSITPMVLSKRRFLVTGTTVGEIATGQSFEARRRAALLYACEPTKKNRDELVGFGVRWFLAYLPAASQEFTAPDEVVFTQGSYAVIKLGIEP